jgi:polyhydroxyalkanoate synthesis regulator phasin
MIDPNLDNVRSTRRFGALLTALKRALLQFLDQYHQELIAQQSRFNIALLERVDELERELAEIKNQLKGRA